MTVVELTDVEPTANELALAPAAQDLLFRQAHTANTFTDEPVTDDQLRAVHELIKYGPTSSNSQPGRITLVRSPQARARLVSHMAPGNQAKTAAAPLVAVVTADREFHRHLPQVFPPNPGLRDGLAADPDRRESVATLSATLQLAYFLIGLRAAGLAAGPMGGFDAAGLEADLFPAGDQKVLAVVNIGFPGPDAFRDRLPRLEFEQVYSTI